ncbi:O-acetyl-ADP-ribose deacetylase [Desulfonema magnum]|uniref:ADP-ribose binding module macro domain-containing protein n=1 Tax=Desulfonema magnum TaxID=45655 RepID=A0A975BN62_9BACT|nr:O-acetyl-ADP-ribose deacetylase [Desulfonema magnum]QTA88089.1 ADP-ribose binding module macro domain-containing protein [Desulfonema magnum]
MNKKLHDRMEVMQGDITKPDVDAIVNAANNSLLGGGGVDGAIHSAAGPELLAECRTIGGCPTGEARITKGYRLPAQYIIHTVGPVCSGKPRDSKLLTSCCQNSLQLAVENNVSTIAFPAVSCGVYGYPIKDACKIAVDTAAAFLKENLSVKKVIFIQFSSENYDVYMDYLNSL